MTNENVLDKTRTYLVGHMQYSDGRNWREYVETVEYTRLVRLIEKGIGIHHAGMVGVF